MLSAEQRDEICATLETVRGELDDLVVRGLRAAGPDDLRTLDAAREELGKIGATHIAGRAGSLVDAIRADARDAPSHYMRAQTSLRVFERVLTLDHVAGLLDGVEPRAPAAAEPAVEKEEEEEKEKEAPRKRVRKSAKTVAKGKTAAVVKAPLPARPPPPPLTLDEGKKLLPTLDDLLRCVDDLVATGLTTASEATRQKLDVSMREALRLRLARLGASLRFVNEEIGRFLAHNQAFSGRRLSFFLNRSWLVAHGVARAIRAGDASALSRLLLTPPATPVGRLEVAALGMGKRIVKSTASCAFEGRLRVLADAPPIKADQHLVWSCLFSYDGSFPPEAFLHLPQPQRFLPRLFCEPSALVVENAAVTLDDAGGGRLILGPQSTVTPAATRIDWARWCSFDAAAAAARLRAHTPSPLDVEVELMEEVVLDPWIAGAPAPRPGREEQLVYPIQAGGLALEAVVSAGPDGAELRAALDALRADDATRPPLFGLLHYELCRLIFQPLSLVEKAGPRHLAIATDHKFDPRTLADLTRALMSRR